MIDPHPDQIRWNTKYQKNLPGANAPKASSWLLELESMLAAETKGPALDIACGLGGNSLLLAKWGYQVDAVDISDVAINLLARWASSYSIQPYCRNLETDSFPSNSYQIIINFHYLNRDLFRPIQEALLPGGLLIFQTFYHEPGNKDNRPMNPAYLLEKGELISAFEELELLHHEEIPGNSFSGKPKAIARFIGRKR